MDVSAGEHTIPNEVEVMATELEENNQVTATAGRAGAPRK
jgi:hypothetical protein